MIFRINSHKDLAIAYKYARITLASKDLKLTWEAKLILLIWKILHRKRYVAALLLYIRGKYHNIHEPLIHARKLSRLQIEVKLLSNNWY